MKPYRSAKNILSTKLQNYKIFNGATHVSIIYDTNPQFEFNQNINGDFINKEENKSIVNDNYLSRALNI